MLKCLHKHSISIKIKTTINLQHQSLIFFPFQSSKIRLNFRQKTLQLANIYHITKFLGYIFFFLLLVISFIWLLKAYSQKDIMDTIKYDVMKNETIPQTTKKNLTHL